MDALSAKQVSKGAPARVLRAHYVHEYRTCPQIAVPVEKKKKLKLSVEQEQQHKEGLDDITTTPSALLKRQNRKHIFPKHTGAYWKMSTTAHFCSPGENRFRTSIS